MVRSVLLVLVVGTLAAGCVSTGNLGIVMKSSSDPAARLRTSQGFEDLGQVEGEGCRHFLLAIIPWGNSDVSKAVDDALKGTGGDAMINVTTETSLYGFIPIYNVYSYTCTKVKGTAIKFN